jgi:NitT/TauT family transport system ATP-binding protein
VLFVTHSIAEAIRVGSRILLLTPHPGQVKAELNSLARENQHTHLQKELEEKINSMLFIESNQTQVEVFHE